MDYDISAMLTEGEWPKPEEEPCKGLVFRGYRNMFISGDHIGFHQGVKLLKRKSCPGCEHCGYMLDEAREMISCDALLFPDIEHGKLYGLKISNIHKDWESGIVDDYDLEVYMLPKEEQE